MSSFNSGKIAGQFLHLGLELGLNLGQSGILSFASLKLGVFLSELFIFFSELALQLGNLFLGGLQLGGVSSSS